MNTIASSSEMPYHIPRPSVLDVSRPVVQPEVKSFRGYSVRKRIAILLWVFVLASSGAAMAAGIFSSKPEAPTHLAVSVGCG